MSSTFPYDRFIRYDELTSTLGALADTYPNLLRVISLGKSYEGRDIWCAKVTNFETGPDDEKPAVYADANIHATEVSPTTACTHLLQTLLEGFGKDAEITRALNTRVFYLIPRVNPDGAEVFLSDTPRYLRSSTRPYPFDEEPIEGLKREDIDGDGLTLQMRIPDSNGPWKKAGDGRRMVRREPTEVGGEYFRILPEGRITNFDGTPFGFQRSKEGLDLNRNFPAHWRPEHEQYGAGPYPTSEPEARAIVDFIASHLNICCAVTFHTHGGVHLRPYGTEPDDHFASEDLWTYQAIGKKGTELTGYPAVSVYHDFRYHPKEVITGVFDDWCFDHFGIFAWTTEIWSPQRMAGIIEGFGAETKSGAFRFTSWSRDHTDEEAQKLYNWANAELDGKAYYDWKPFEHPELGPVEIGGWDILYAFRNPSPRFLEAEIERFTPWLIWQALCTPQMVLYSTKVDSLGDDTWRIRMEVVNQGWLPSYGSKKALERKVVRPVVAEIALPVGASLLVGKERVELTQLEGRNLKSASNTGYIADVTADDRAHCEWVVRAPRGATIRLTARHQRAGVVRTNVLVGG